MTFFFSVTIKKNKNFTKQLPYNCHKGTWNLRGTLNLCSWAMATYIWLQNKLCLIVFELRVVLFSMFNRTHFETFGFSEGDPGLHTSLELLR